VATTSWQSTPHQPSGWPPHSTNSGQQSNQHSLQRPSACPAVEQRNRAHRTDHAPLDAPQRPRSANPADIDQIALLLGVADVAASKRFYVDLGLAVARSLGRMYVEFDTPSSPVKPALYKRRALAKDAGVSPDGTGSHRLMIGTNGDPFTDVDGIRLGVRTDHRTAR